MAITCTVDETGIHVPPFEDILTFLQQQYRGIYGQDVYLEPDSQDGQMLGIFAAAINDANAMAAAVYNAFSPSTAQGVGLARVVKINGIARLIASYSTVDLTVAGTPGTIIPNGYAIDDQQQRWNLPVTVTIPPAGSITVTATADDLGDVEAPANTITGIGTPTRGWVSVNNPVDAAPGAPLESDATLRRRQAVSTALPSKTVLDGIIGAVASLPGVTRYTAADNDMPSTDAHGIPPNSLAMVVEGGDAAAIAAAIAGKKGPGSGTAGSIVQSVVDNYGIPHAVRFFRPELVTIKFVVTVRPLSGFTSLVSQKIQQALADWAVARAIGEDIFLTRVYVPANLPGDADGDTYEIVGLQIARDSDAPAAADIALGFVEAAVADVDDVAVVIAT